jgi:hypothetical protein
MKNEDYEALKGAITEVGYIEKLEDLLTDAYEALGREGHFVMKEEDEAEIHCEACALMRKISEALNLKVVE